MYTTPPRKIVRALALLALVSGLTASPASVAAPTSPDGSFETGLAGWRTTGADQSKLRLTPASRTGDRAALLRRATRGKVALTHRGSLAAGVKQGRRYVVRAHVSTTQSTQRGVLTVRQHAAGKKTLVHRKQFRLQRGRWTSVPLRLTGRAGDRLTAVVRGFALRSRERMLVDDITVSRTAASTTTPTTIVPSAYQLTNGCGVNARGIPSCGSLLGSAYGSNTDPTAWEKEMGTHLGVRRTYYSASQVSSAVDRSRTDLANGRIPWISFKLPYSWEQMATGAGDAWARDLAKRLSALNGPVWLAFHHEPEGDGDIKAWTRMQARLAPIVRKAAPNVAYSIVLTGWNQLYGDAKYSLSSLWPTGTKIDLAGFDVYNKYGSPKGTGVHTTHTDFLNDYFKPFQAWSLKNNVAWGIAETGFTDSAAVDRPNWVSETLAEMKRTGGIAFTYFNTTLNSVANWALSTTIKMQSFRTALTQAPSLK